MSLMNGFLVETIPVSFKNAQNCLDTSKEEPIRKAFSMSILPSSFSGV